MKEQSEYEMLCLKCKNRPEITVTRVGKFVAEDVYCHYCGNKLLVYGDLISGYATLKERRKK